MATNLWLLLGLLTSQSSELAATREAPPTVVTTLIRNLRIDPAHRTLSWDPAPSTDITTEFACRKDGDLFSADPGLTRCSFPSLSLCRSTDFAVLLGEDRVEVGSIRFPPDDGGDREAAAKDLRCWVHDVGRLSCRWERGPRAAGDVRYRMFWRDTQLDPTHDRECPHYHSDDVTATGPAPHGGHEGCTLDLDPDLGSDTQVDVTVNGSGHAGPVPCMDDTMDLQHVEVLVPPTLKVECSGSDAHVQWFPQTRFHHNLLGFTLQVNQSSRPVLQEFNFSTTHFRVPNAGAITFRVRARSEVDPGKLSGWSNTWGLVCPLEVKSMTTVLVTSAAVVLGTGLIAAGFLLCWRKSLLSRLCPPIPHLRLPLAGETVAWAPAPEDCEVTPVTDA
ncbi:interleukin-3 receptor subunit alpha-like [Mus pahari]|uniref:interleukin-3 receptor subunit alpha-like n=1 Tax=Mus pahari TaxID=10093 RepID=UPI000FC8FAFA|nr:interleukin-3 receptor subunit alpha-like [Mus pahari]